MNVIKKYMYAATTNGNRKHALSTKNDYKKRIKRMKLSRNKTKI